MKSLPADKSRTIHRGGRLVKVQESDRGIPLLDEHGNFLLRVPCDAIEHFLPHCAARLTRRGNLLRMTLKEDSKEVRHLIANSLKSNFGMAYQEHIEGGLLWALAGVRV